jgi:hypothetical protein
MVDKNMNLIRMGIYKGLQKLVTIIADKAKAFNLKLAHQEANTFVTTAFGENKPLNMTMTKAPYFSPDKGLIQFYMDGRFMDTVTNTARSTLPTVFPELVDGKQREEIFIHQSMINALVFDMVKTYNCTNITTEVLKAFPEIAAYYGDAAKIKVELTFNNQAAGNFDQITFDAKDGIKIGDEKMGGLITDMKILASNATADEEVAAKLQFGLNMAYNFTFDNFLIFKHFSDQKVINTIVKESKVDFATTNWDETMTGLVTALGNDYNSAHVDGIDLKKNQIVGFVAGLLRHTLLTPYVADEYLYGGFSWITDGV